MLAYRPTIIDICYSMCFFDHVEGIHNIFNDCIKNKVIITVS